MPIEKNKLKNIGKEVVPSEDSMDVDVGVHESNDTKMEVEEDTAIDGKEKNRVRMAMQKTRKDAEYRKKESEPIVVEVEDVPLEEDQEFRTTILSPESNLRPTGDEWIMPVVLFPEPADQLEKNRVRIRMAMQETRKDAEYRKTERATDSASKKRKWDSMSQEEKDEINRKMRERAKVRRAEEKKKRAEQDQEKTPQELEEDKRMAEEEKRKAISSDPFANRSQAFKEKEQELEKLCVNSGTTYELPHVGESQYQTSKRRARLNQLVASRSLLLLHHPYNITMYLHRYLSSTHHSSLNTHCRSSCCVLYTYKLVFVFHETSSIKKCPKIPENTHSSSVKNYLP